MKKVFILLLVSANSYSSDCGYIKPFTCSDIKQYTVKNIKPLLLNNQIVSIYKDTMDVKTDYVTDGKFSIELEEDNPSNIFKIEAPVFVKNTKLYGAFDHIVCRDGFETLKKLPGEPLKYKFRVFSKIYIGPFKCSKKAELFLNSSNKINKKDISYNTLIKNEMIVINKTNSIWTFFAPPLYMIHINVSDNLCSDKICNPSKKMPIVKGEPHNILLFDDEGKLYYPEKIN